MDEVSTKLETWVIDQKALARTFGLSIEEWLEVLAQASKRKTGLTAAVVGAAIAEGLGLGVLERLDPEALMSRARELIDPEPPDLEDPVLREAVRRAEELESGKGASRLKKKKPVRTEVESPRRETIHRPSAGVATADAPGDDE